MFELGEDRHTNAVIKVIGVGGGGSNAVSNMISAGLVGVDFITANTDKQALDKSLAPIKIQLGQCSTKGLGAGANPQVGRHSAEEDVDSIADALSGADMVFITCGMGGGTGTGAAPVIAQVAKDSGALTVAVVTKPFSFEGKKRMRQAEEGLAELKRHVDTIITIPNQRLLGIIEKNTTFKESFQKVDDVLHQAVKGISDVIMMDGYVNLDFADVKTIMSNMGRAVMGVGVAKGENRAVVAAQKAISSPLLEEGNIDGARGVLINFTGGKDLTMSEIIESSNIIQEAADEDANIIFGSVINEDLVDEIHVTVIATGFEDMPSVMGIEAHCLPKPAAMAQPLADVPPVHQTAVHVPKIQAVANSSYSDVHEINVGDEFYLGKIQNLKDYIESAPGAYKKAAGQDYRNETLGIEDDDLDVPTFLRRHAD
jgi:cell division protein FtsZ